VPRTHWENQLTVSRVMFRRIYSVRCAGTAIAS